MEVRETKMLYHILFSTILGLILVLFIWERNKYLTSFASALFVVFVVAYPLAYFDTLGRPKGLSEEFFKRNVESVEILGYLVKPNVALYLLVGIEGVPEPRYYVLPWSEDTKKKAQSLHESFGKQGVRMGLKRPFRSSFETDRPPELYGTPPSAPPDKQPLLPGLGAEEFKVN